MTLTVTFTSVVQLVTELEIYTFLTRTVEQKPIPVIDNPPGQILNSHPSKAEEKKILHNEVTG